MWRKTIQIIIQSDLERWKNLKNGIFYLKKKQETKQTNYKTNLNISIIPI